MIQFSNLLLSIFSIESTYMYAEMGRTQNIYIFSKVTGKMVHILLIKKFFFKFKYLREE